MIRDIVMLAAELNGEERVDQNIKNYSQNAYGFENCTHAPEDGMRIPVAKAAGKYGWFKSIGKAEVLAENIIAPHIRSFDEAFRTTIRGLRNWAANHGDQG